MKTAQIATPTKNKAQKALWGLYESSRSWAKVARDLGFSKGFVYRVARGDKRPTAELLRRLHLPVDRVLVAAKPCQSCGQVHVSKRCTVKKTFEDHAREYDAWINDPATQAKLAALIEWAEAIK